MLLRLLLLLRHPLLRLRRLRLLILLLLLLLMLLLLLLPLLELTWRGTNLANPKTVKSADTPSPSQLSGRLLKRNGVQQISGTGIG